MNTKHPIAHNLAIIPVLVTRLLHRKKNLAIATLVIMSAIIAGYNLSSRSRSAWQYPFQRPEVGSVTKNIQKEISFYQQRIQERPTSGLEKASLAQSYLKMARATGDSSWYLLAQQSAEQSLAQLSVHNYGATMVLAKIAAAKHEFKRALVLLQPLPPQSEMLSLSTTIHLALGDTTTARKNADNLAQKTPTLSNFTLKALVEVAQGQDTAALKDFQLAIAAEDAEEAGSSAWVRTLLGRFYYKRGQLDKAEELYQSALQILPKYPPALLNSAELSIRRWQDNPSQDHYRLRAAEIYQQFFLNSQQTPTIYDHIALRGSARIQHLQGNQQQAERIWQQAIAKLRSDVNGFGHRRELAQLLLERGQSQDRAEALTLMQAEIKNRQDPETWDTLAAIYFQLNQLPAAETAIQKALASGIRDPGIMERAGAIAEAQGQSDRAKEYRERVGAIDPQFTKGARQALGLGVGLSGLN
jgi:tetratricopeptide (TPR) repeat protein